MSTRDDTARLDHPVQATLAAIALVALVMIPASCETTGAREEPATAATRAVPSESPPAPSTGATVVETAVAVGSPSTAPDGSPVAGPNADVVTSVPAAPALEAFEELVPDTTLSFEMIPIPAGVSDRSEAREQGFWIAKTEMTWELFDVFVYRLDDGGEITVGSAEPKEEDADAETRPSKPYISMDRGFGHAGFPAISMSYLGATAFCDWLSLKTGRRYRLPTLAEWTAVCAAGGIDPAAIDEHAWHEGNADYTTHRVAGLKPDANGLHDLYGNASEWCTIPGEEPLVVGGAYLDPPDVVGCTMTETPIPDWNGSDPQIPRSIWWLADASWVGFRVVCDPPGDR